MSEYIVSVDGQMPDAIHERALEEIVRCRDCKHYYEGECFLTDGMGDFKRWLVDDDDYCSDGERAVDA